MNKYLITSTLTIIIWPSLLSTAFGQVYPCGLPNTTNIVQNMNVSRNRPVIVIGNVSEKPYVVVVPGNSQQLLTQIRKYIQDAFLTQNRLGTYIYAGGYKNRFQAQCWTNLLNSQGIDARVVYFR
ncbi:MAG: hypothetical protein EAZ76_10370 [Nostocales cyanobacterium]|nr:MAG: hypothetical protein EAZ87_22615 [Nostocales cyanobacterium]TAF13991.1 MAG: hypothetical protein EAZ76_10370 [Nostocales cyanobacterium]